MVKLTDMSGIKVQSIIGLVYIAKPSEPVQIAFDFDIAAGQYRIHLPSISTPVEEVCLSDKLICYGHYSAAYFSQLDAVLLLENHACNPRFIWKQSGILHHIKLQELNGKNIQNTSRAMDYVTVNPSSYHPDPNLIVSDGTGELKRYISSFSTSEYVTPAYVSNIDALAPDMVTLIPTYKCTAACKQCCFGSNPEIKTRLSKTIIVRRLTQALHAFPDIKLLVISGGECFLLGEDLFDVLRYAASRGLKTRCVTNGFWGKSVKLAERNARKLQECNITEMNISTGDDHQEFVPPEHVVTASQALLKFGIRTLVTIESDDSVSELQSCKEFNEPRFMKRPDVQLMVNDYPELFSIQVNTWMSFDNITDGRGIEGCKSLNEGCDQLFHNLVITPHDRLSSCCGLTFEHIPEMKLGTLDDSVDMRKLYFAQLEDFLKIWIHIDGPMEIMRKLYDAEEVDKALKNVNHICQACAILHKHPGVRQELNKRYLEFIPEILPRLNLKTEVRNLDLTT